MPHLLGTFKGSLTPPGILTFSENWFCSHLNGYKFYISNTGGLYFGQRGLTSGVFDLLLVKLKEGKYSLTFREELAAWLWI